MVKPLRIFGFLLLVLLAPLAVCAGEIKLINVSYDPTRELYEEINRAFIEDYRSKTGDTVSIEQSHGGSSKQARSILDGVQADVATLALGYDINALQSAGLVARDWQKRLPNNSTPYTSTIVLLVRKSNPKQIKDWQDLIKPDVKVVVANPKTSGGARWAFLAAWGYGAGAKGAATSGGSTEKQSLDEAKGNEFVAKLYKNVPVLDTGARGATVTFASKNVGDVLLSWENEAWLAEEEFGADKFEIVYPSVSILAEPPVAVVDKVVDARGTRAAAEAYLKFLYTPAAQEIIAENHYRPRSGDTLAKFAKDLPAVPLFTLDSLGYDWDKAQPHFFGDKGVSI